METSLLIRLYSLGDVTCRGNIMFVIVVLAIGCIMARFTNVAANGLAECIGTDCINPYVWSTTTVNCTEEICDASYDCRWPSGFNSRMDERVYGGRIIAYQLQWSTGSWSSWFVPGMNDLDAKFNTGVLSCSVPYPAKGLRRAWAYFYDHTHRVIICR